MKRPRLEKSSLNEVYRKSGLGKWFHGQSAGGEPGWDRYDGSGKKAGKCGDSKPGEPYAACLSKQKAASLGKKGVASFVRRKRAAQNKAGKGDKDIAGKGNKPINVSYKTKKTRNEEMLRFSDFAMPLNEKNVPTNKKLWSSVLSQARSKFDVFPSAYASAWASKQYKAKGGGWRVQKEDINCPCENCDCDPCDCCRIDEARSAGYKMPQSKDPYTVKYSKSKRGPIQTTVVDGEKAAKKFLAGVQKQGMKGIITKGGHQKESADYEPADSMGKRRGAHTMNIPKTKKRTAADDARDMAQHKKMQADYKKHVAKHGELPSAAAERKRKERMRAFANRNQNEETEDQMRQRKIKGAERVHNKRVAAEKKKKAEQKKIHSMLRKMRAEDIEQVDEKSAAWTRKEGQNKEGGLNAKGRASYERENPGSDLKAPVSAAQAKKSKGGKAAKRRKSFCARMGGMPGPMKDEKGRPTRKALALRKWDC